MWEVTEVQHST